MLLQTYMYIVLCHWAINHMSFVLTSDYGINIIFIKQIIYKTFGDKMKVVMSN